MTADPWFRNHLIRDAIGRAIYDRMKADPSIYLMGEGAEIKMHFDAPQVEREFPERVRTFPIAEDSSVNFAVGASLLGVTPVVDIITADFMYRAMDSICDTAAKLNFTRPIGEPEHALVIRGEYLLGGPTTGNRPEAHFLHVPGLNVVVPSTPRDAYGLMITALTSPGVTIFFEDRMIKDTETAPEDCHDGSESIPFGQAAWRRRPDDAELTILCYGLMRQVVEGIVGLLPAHIVDLRTLWPMDWESILWVARETGKVLIVEPDVAVGGVGAEIAATLAERCPGLVIRRLGGPRRTIPASLALHATVMPTAEDIARAAWEVAR